MKLKYALCLSISFLAWDACAQSESIHNDEWKEDIISVKQRWDPDQQPLGIRVPGMFLLHPSIELREIYDDNIFRTPSNRQSDLISVIKPGALLKSDWARHGLQFRAEGAFGRYLDNDSENYEDYLIEGKGRLDIVYDTYLEAVVRHEHLHEVRSDPDDVRGLEPTEFDITTERLNFIRELGRLKLYTYARHAAYDFDDVQGASGIIDNDLRDRDVIDYQAKFAYEFIPNYEAFVQATLNHRRYDDTSMSNRDSDGFEASTGTEINLTGKVKGSAFVGYMEQDYGDGFEDIDSINFGGSLLWDITGMTTLYAAVEREALETTFSSTSGYIRTSYGLTLEHALMRNLFLDATLKYLNDDFVAIPSVVEREDDTYFASLGMDYLPLRGMRLRLGYDYATRDSNQNAQDYTNNRVLGSFRYTY